MHLYSIGSGWYVTSTFVYILYMLCYINAYTENRTYPPGAHISAPVAQKGAPVAQKDAPGWLLNCKSKPRAH